jgi:hypothetical protein
MDEDVYLTNFTACKSYKNPDGTHIEEQEQHLFGTIEYASIRTQSGLN